MCNVNLMTQCNVFAMKLAAILFHDNDRQFHVCQNDLPGAWFRVKDGELNGKLDTDFITDCFGRYLIYFRRMETRGFVLIPWPA